MFQELGFRLLEHLLVSIDLSCMNKKMITAEDGVSTRASLYSDPVYFEE